MRDLVDDGVETEGVVDIFKAAGIERVDVSILDDAFLQTFKDRPHQDLRVKLLEKLVHDELHARSKQNLAKARSFRAMLEETLQRYHNRLIDAAAVIKAMIEIHEDAFLRDLVHEVVQSIKRNLKVDWTEPHREDVRSGIRAAVKRVLRSKGIRADDFDRFVEEIMEQAEALFGEWPLAA